MTTFPMHRPSPWMSPLGSQLPTASTSPHLATDPLGDHRLAMLERKEPTRRLVRDVIGLRRLRKLSQSALAAELGVSKRTWQEWEQGRRLPSGVGRALLERWARDQEMPGEN